MIHKVTLRTPCAQRIYNRTFAEVARNLYSLNVVARLISKNEQTVDELNAIVEQRFSEVEELVTAEIERIKVLRDESGIEAVPEYTDPKTFECDVSTPMALKYIKLLRNIDEIVVLLDSLWLTEEIDDKQKLRGEYLWQSRAIKLSNQFRDLYSRSRSAQKRQRQEDAEANKQRKEEKDQSEDSGSESENPEDEIALVKAL